MAQKTETVISKSKKIKDADLENHYKELERYDLTSTEWRHKTYDNPRHDCVSELIDRYLIDLRERKLVIDWEQAKAKLRKEFE